MRARPLFALLALPALAGCLATRQDVQAVQARMDALEAAQERLIREMRLQNEALLDSLSRQQTRTRGDLANRLLQMERQLVQIQELTGQSQQSVAQLRNQLRERERQDATAGAGEGGGTPAIDPANAQAAYDEALAAYRRESYGTARSLFEEFLRAAPAHRLAPDALFYVAETHARDRQFDRAVAAFDRVVELHPASARAAEALFRAGQVELGRGNRDAARQRFTQVRRAYPNSEAATQARRELDRMGR